ncbi:acyltransferase family protein [Massilia sp. GCM10023247]|uniref:acyltransferase family protein n=1 Tax=Massilia sp. GCM10023247 TaxID=3252643 RepID=UPI0036161E68
MKAGAGAAAPAVERAEFGVINLFKAVAAQLIVLHHLAFYGPMADHARPLMPDLIDWLAGDARIAVQVFLVIGGFLAAKSLSPEGLPGLVNPFATIWRRYLKLAPPFMVAMLLAIGASALASTWMIHDSISAPPSVGQLAAHALLLHDVLGYEALSAGAWYVAIDFQLYAVLSLLLWMGGRLAGKRVLPWLMPLVVTVAVGASLLFFNRDSEWDIWAPYFFGSYGLGVLAWWAGDSVHRPRTVAVLLLMIALPALVALALDFRSRIAVAVAVACVLVLFGRLGTSSVSNGAWRLVSVLGKISYSVFLVHFPVCLFVNAVFVSFLPSQGSLQAVGALIAWAGSLAAGAIFFRWVELPIGRALTPCSAGLPTIERRWSRRLRENMSKTQEGTNR